MFRVAPRRPTLERCAFIGNRKTRLVQTATKHLAKAGKTRRLPQVDRAIAFEDQMNRVKGEAPEPELVSRAVQSGVGLLTGVVVYGTAFGGLEIAPVALLLASDAGSFMTGSVVVVDGGYLLW